MKKAFYKTITIAILIATFILARYEYKTIGTISGLTLLPIVLILVPYACESIARDIVSMWKSLNEEEENEEA